MLLLLKVLLHLFFILSNLLIEYSLNIMERIADKLESCNNNAGIRFVGVGGIFCGVCKAEMCRAGGAFGKDTVRRRNFAGGGWWSG